MTWIEEFNRENNHFDFVKKVGLKLVSCEKVAEAIYDNLKMYYKL